MTRANPRMDVLLVEDDDLVRETSAEILADAGLDVTEAATGEQALRLSDEKGAPSVLVTDVDLGAGMNGLEVARTARGRWPGVGVLYITGRPGNMEGVPLRARERYLAKPFRSTTLVGMVRTLLDAARK